MKTSVLVSITLALSLLLTPLGLPTLKAANEALDAFLGGSRQLASVVRCANLANWTIEGLVTGQRSCVCLTVFPLSCSRAQPVPGISVEPPRSPFYDVKL
jgi:hypothetical protein